MPAADFYAAHSLGDQVEGGEIGEELADEIDSNYSAAYSVERAFQATLLRDIFGTIVYRRTVINPALLAPNGFRAKYVNNKTLRPSPRLSRWGQ